MLTVVSSASVMMIKKDSYWIKADCAIKKIRWWNFLILGTLVMFSFDYLISNIDDTIDKVIKEQFDDDIIFNALFFAPLVETFLFQMVPIELFTALAEVITHKKYPILVICLSSALFASAHSYCPMYVIGAFFIGLVLSICYYVFRRQKHWGYGYIITFTQHFLVNSGALINNQLFQ